MSHRGDLTDRLLQIPLLLAERPRTLQDLAKLCNASKKTIKRDLDALSSGDSRYPITEERDGRRIRYKFRDDYKYQPPVFEVGELATLLLAQESIAAAGVTGIGSPFAKYGQSLLSKVRVSLPEALQKKLDALSTVFGTASVPAKNYAPHAATIDQLTTATSECRQVRLKYYTLGSDSVKERTVDPYSVYFDPDGGTIKLLGFDHSRKIIIPFSIDHIRSLKMTDERFTRPPDFDLRKFLEENCFNGIHGEPIEVRLRAYGVTARVFAERTFHSSQKIIESTDKNSELGESVTIGMRVARGRGLVRFVLSWAPDVEVLSPASVIEEVSKAHELALARIRRET